MYVSMFLCVRLQISRPRWRREIVQDGTQRFVQDGAQFPFLGAVPQGSPKSQILGLNVGHLTANISKAVSRSDTCQ